MADISGLTLNAPEPIDFDNYQEGGEYTPPPVEGQYFVQSPSNVVVKASGEKADRDAITISSTKEGQLKATLNPLTITDANAAGVGYQILYTGISAKKSKNRNSSQVGDYLRANGIASVSDQTPQGLANLIEMTAGRIFPVTTRWEAYCKDCDYTVEGQDKFPKAAEDDSTNVGGRSYKVPCAHCKKDLYARLKVNRYVSTVGAGA